MPLSLLAVRNLGLSLAFVTRPRRAGMMPIANFDHIAFERADKDDVNRAFAIYKETPGKCLQWMMMTLHPSEDAGFQWNLRTHEPFCKEFPRDAKQLNDDWEDKAAEMPDSCLGFADFHFLRCTPVDVEEQSLMYTLYVKIFNNPRHDDIWEMLCGISENPAIVGDAENFKAAYTYEVHGLLVELLDLYRLPEGERKNVRERVRIIGKKLHRAGGLTAQQAVFYAAVGLLRHRTKGDFASTLNAMWDGCGEWKMDGEHDEHKKKQERSFDSILEFAEHLSLAEKPDTYEKKQEMIDIYEKILKDPRRDDVLSVLNKVPDTAIWQKAYTPEVHAQLVALVKPLKALIHDVDDKNKATLRPPVRAIGTELDKLGGIEAQRAVYYALVNLLVMEQSRCSDGQPWADAASTLQFAWDGCGRWVA